MEHANHATATPPMRPETEKKLLVLAYHPRHASDPDAVLRLARETLGRPGLTHRALAAIGEADAQILIAALERAYPDKTWKVAAKVAKHMKDRLD